MRSAIMFKFSKIETRFDKFFFFIEPNNYSGFFISIFLNEFSQEASVISYIDEFDFKIELSSDTIDFIISSDNADDCAILILRQLTFEQLQTVINHCPAIYDKFFYQFTYLTPCPAPVPHDGGRASFFTPENFPLTPAQIGDLYILINTEIQSGDTFFTRENLQGIKQSLIKIDKALGSSIPDDDIPPCFLGGIA